MGAHEAGLVADRPDQRGQSLLAALPALPSVCADMCVDTRTDMRWAR